VVMCLERSSDCLHTVQLMLLHLQTPSSLASFKFRLVSPFWYRLTQVVLEKRPLNGRSSSSVVYISLFHFAFGMKMSPMERKLQSSIETETKVYVASWCDSMMSDTGIVMTHNTCTDTRHRRRVTVPQTLLVSTRRKRLWLWLGAFTNI